ITYLDAIHWIDAGWKAVISATVINTFGVAGSKAKLDDNITIVTSRTSNDLKISLFSNDPTTTVTDDKQFVGSKKLDHSLQYVRICGKK
ncbi:unnamed protein product, partial [Rotaria sp. Silwood1]